MRLERFALAAMVATLWAPLMGSPPAVARSHSTGPALIEVRAADEALPEVLAEKIKGIEGVGRVEKYLLVRGQLNDKIGVEPSAPLRILTKDERLVVGRVEFGRAFRETEGNKNVALVNRVPRSPPGMGSMASMVHYFGVGQTFVLQESRVRILGEVVAPTDHKIFLPLSTAQRLYGKKGLLTHIFVRVQDATQLERVRKALAASLGPAVRIRRR